MTFQRRIILLLILLVLPVFVHPQSYYFRHYQADDGLAHNAVSAILQDSRGFMWIGTKGGLNRFDGFSFKTFKSCKGKPGTLGIDAIASLCEDRAGRIWVGTIRGTFVYDPLHETFAEPFVHPFVINNLMVDERNHIWFLSQGQIFEYDQQKRKLTDHHIQGHTLVFDRQGKIWIGTTDGALLHYDPATLKTEYIQILPKGNSPRSRVINKVMPCGDDEILIGSRQYGLKSYNRKTGVVRSLLSRDRDNADIFVRDILDAHDGNYWIGTESGIYIYHSLTGRIENLRKRLGDNYSLSDNAVYCLYKDNRGGFWAGTFFGGLNYASGESMKFRKYYPIAGANSISGDAVREICADSLGNIWIGTEDAGVNKFDIRSGAFTHFTSTPSASGISYPNIHGLLAVGKTLYVGPFQHGLNIMDAQTGKVTKRFKLVGGDDAKSDFVVTIYRQRNGKILFGTTGAGLVTFDDAEKKFIRVPHFPRYSSLYCILEDHEGTIWGGSISRGVFYSNEQKGTNGNISFRNLKDPNSRDDIVQGIYEDTRHNLWLTTEGSGLIKLRPNRTIEKKYTTADGFPTNNLYRTLEDKRGNLWISSLKGLICFNPVSGRIKVYTQANGLITDQFNYNSAYKDGRGNMYFGSVKGLIVFNPDDLELKQTPPPTYFTSFQVNNEEVIPGDRSNVLKKSILVTDTIVLKYNQSNFSIGFATLNFSSAGVTRFRYMMKGLDNGWTYLNSNRRAYFTDLSPGSYTFIVKGESNVNEWSGTERRLFIKVLPPLWLSPAAYVIYFILLSSLIFFSVRYYHRYLERKNTRRLQFFELEKEKEIYQAKIEFFTHIAHEIQTPLTLIIAPVDNIKKKLDDYPPIRKSIQLIDKHAKRLLNLTDQLLDFRKTEIHEFGLSFVNADISALLEEQVHQFEPEIEKRNISISLSLPEEHFVAFVDLDAFQKITGNLISNAVKYSETMVAVSLIANSGEPDFRIRFENDGDPIPQAFSERIFEPFFRLRGNEKPGTGIGLSLAKSLTELHNGTLRLLNEHENLIVFELILPVHQKFEFKLNKWKKFKDE